MLYMVAIDDSDNALWAFHTALYLARDDELLIATIVDDVRLYGGLSGKLIHDLQAEVKGNGNKLIRKFIKVAEKEGLEHRVKGVLGVSAHAGEMLCQIAEKRGVDVLVIGRRGMGTVKRLFMGSTSKHVVEHAHCDVFVVKVPIDLAETHGDKSAVLDAEESERARRMAQPRPGCPPASYIALKAADASPEPVDADDDVADIEEWFFDHHHSSFPKGTEERTD